MLTRLRHLLVTLTWVVGITATLIVSPIVDHLCGSGVGWIVASALTGATALIAHLTNQRLKAAEKE